MYTIWYIVVLYILFCGLNVVLPITAMDRDVPGDWKIWKDFIMTFTIKKNFHRLDGPHPVTDKTKTIQFEQGDIILVACRSSYKLLLQVQYYGMDLVKINDSNIWDELPGWKSVEIRLPLDKFDDGLNVSCTNIYKYSNPTTKRIQFDFIKKVEILTSTDEVYTTVGQSLPISCKGKAILHKNYEIPRLLKTVNGRISDTITMEHNGTVIRCYYFDENTYTYSNIGEFDIRKRSWMIFVDLKYKMFEDFMKELNVSVSSPLDNVLNHIFALYAFLAVILCLNIISMTKIFAKVKSRQESSVEAPSCVNLQDIDDDETMNHAYDVIEEFISVQDVPPTKIRDYLPRPLTPEDNEENQPYIHYDTPYEERFARMAAALLTRRNLRPRLHPHVHRPRRQPN